MIGRSAGIVHILFVRSISFHVALRVSDVRVTVKIKNSNARAATPDCSRRAIMNALTWRRWPPVNLARLRPQASRASARIGDDRYGAASPHRSDISQQGRRLRCRVLGHREHRSAYLPINPCNCVNRVAHGLRPPLSDPPGRRLLSRMLRSRRRSLHSCATQYRHRGEYRFDVADNVVGAVGLYRNWCQ